MQLFFLNTWGILSGWWMGAGVKWATCICETFHIARLPHTTERQGSVLFVCCLCITYWGRARGGGGSALSWELWSINILPESDWASDVRHRKQKCSHWLLHIQRDEQVKNQRRLTEKKIKRAGELKQTVTPSVCWRVSVCCATDPLLVAAAK